MYQERMLGYYPPVIQSIAEFQAIVDGEYPEIEDISEGVTRVTEDAYLTTMSEERVGQWEKMLGIQPLADSTLADRRDTIIARIRGQGKLNTESINRIVGAFTGGTADSKIQNGVLYITVHVPNNNKSYKFPNLERELASKVPAHLQVQISRNYSNWGTVANTHQTWADVRTYHEDWEGVTYGVHREAGYLDSTPVNDFVVV